MSSRRAKLLGHVLRSNNDDPLRQFFLPHSATRVEYGKRRCGRPRQNWLHTTKKHVYEHTLGHFNYDESMYEGYMIFAAAAPLLRLRLAQVLTGQSLQGRAWETR